MGGGLGERGLLQPLQAGGDFQRETRDCKALEGIEVRMGKVLSLEAKESTLQTLLGSRSQMLLSAMERHRQRVCTCDDACLDSGDFPAQGDPSADFTMTVARYCVRCFTGLQFTRAI